MFSKRQDLTPFFLQRRRHTGWVFRCKIKDISLQRLRSAEDSSLHARYYGKSIRIA